jgi:hypothetical protein
LSLFWPWEPWRNWLAARIVEPELMDDPFQARAYAEADFDRSDQAFTERFLAFFASQQPCLRCGCLV